MTTTAPSAAPISVPRPPTATQITASIELRRREFAGIDDADLRHIERTGDAGHAGRQREHEQLVGFDPVAEEARAGFRVADRDQHLAEFRRDDGAADQEAERSAPDSISSEQRRAGAVGLHVEAEDVLEIGQAVVAAEAEIVAEERRAAARRSSPG